jgi:hypothetical protein
MTQEDKNLLLKDLSSRIPYNIKVQTPDGDTIQLYSIGNCEMDDTKIRLFINGGYYSDIVKPYLRPMSSMTEEEENEFISLNAVPSPCLLPNHTRMSWYSNATMLDWLNAHHIDYRGLIEKGLALEAPENMYKEK